MTKMMAIAWNDNKSKLVIASVGVSINGEPAEKDRWRLTHADEPPS